MGPLSFAMFFVVSVSFVMGHEMHGNQEFQFIMKHVRTLKDQVNAQYKLLCEHFHLLYSGTRGNCENQLFSTCFSCVGF